MLINETKRIGSLIVIVICLCVCVCVCVYFQSDLNY